MVGLKLKWVVIVGMGCFYAFQYIASHQLPTIILSTLAPSLKLTIKA